MPDAFQTSIAADNRIFDATETLTVQTSTTSAATVTAPYCRRTNRTVMWDQAGAGLVPVNVVTFYLWKNDCPTKPTLGCVITDANGVRYRAGETSEDTTVQTRWDVDCVKEV